ncbi:MAG: FKBP-type peptidyl-prolyl cis-trans isomerase [Bacteroidales bacterium]|nr:FKBP-type peptidyl-prolyl cis-trans isomerase [Candidatus Cacconaster merdequi]
MKKIYGILAAASILLLASCGVEESSSENSYYDKVLKAWVKKNYPESISQKTASGTYILEFEEGTGNSVGDTSFVRAFYVKRNLAGQISETNVKSLCEQLGTYSKDALYEGDIWQMGYGYISSGLEEVIKTMRSGGRAKVAIPLSVATADYGIYSISSTEESDNVIYDISLTEVIPDILQYQKDSLANYSRRLYESLQNIDEGFYFKKLTDRSADKDTLTNGASINVRYLGRLLNGKVFDTNIADSAKFYKIYDSSSSYDALSLSYNSDFEDMASENSIVQGFAKALSMMREGESAITFFWSPLGYKESGSNNIPGYSPLFFYLYIEEN